MAARTSTNILLIPDTSSPKHLSENQAAGDLVLAEDVLAELEKIGKKARLRPAQRKSVA